MPSSPWSFMFQRTFASWSESGPPLMLKSSFADGRDGMRCAPRRWHSERLQRLAP